MTQLLTRWTWIASACVLAALCACSGSAPTPSPPVSTATPRPGTFSFEAAVLELSDVSPGYRVGDDSGCGGISFENASEPLEEFLNKLRYAPLFCARQLESFSDPSAPDVITSSIVRFASDEAAKEALALFEEFLHWQTGLAGVGELAVPAGPGAERRAIALGGDSRGSGAVYAWRSGGDVQYVAITGDAADAALAAAADLAWVQERRHATLANAGSFSTATAEASARTSGLAFTITG